MFRILVFVSVALWVVATAHAAEPIATTDGEMSGTSLAVHQLKVSNGVALLTFTIKNDGDKATDNNSLTGEHDAHSISGVYLIDNVNKKKYLVMYDSANHCVCSRDIQDIPAKASATYWAKFPAPPDDVQKIGLVVPKFLPLDDVPISR
jgi:hypothetical protein